MPLADLGDHQLYFKEWGEGPPCLGVMGFALDSRFWASQIPAVTGSHRFITFDNRGVGRSTGTPTTSMEDMAEDAIALLDHLGIEKSVVFGLSMGGAIAQHVVLRHPERVSALILGITWARPLDFMRRENQLARMIIERAGPDQFHEVGMLRMFTPQFFEVAGEVMDRMVAALMAETGPGGPSSDLLLAQLEAIDKHDVLAELSDVTCPTLVLGGKMDMMVPGFASEEIAAAIPGAELEMFETGHGCVIEEMDAFNARVASFLASLPR
ncbi:MAG TPA: alpha/beta fold hydrolase [Actinomycetota bacterium]|nr:alpha/beta fold hydrolase [Actinomycetota bacterium]